VCVRYVDCYRFRADILDGRGDWPGAQKAYANAVALAPDLPAAYYSWGVALAKHGDLNGAAAKFKDANQKGTALGRSAKSLGRCAREAGPHERGARQIQRGPQIRTELEAAQRSARGGGEAEELIRLPRSGRW
jgi:tetratricopeptide (TPR) repeat protein